MSLFKNKTHQDIWIEHHCGQCWRNGACDIVVKGVAHDRKPVEWDRNTRKNTLMQDTYKCSEQARRPPVVGRLHCATHDQVPMFDVSPTVQIDGDHA